MNRNLKFYSVTEGEYNAVKTFSAQVTVCFSVGSFIFALIAPDWLDFILNRYFGIGNPPTVDEWHKMVAQNVVLGTIAIIFYGIGFWSHRSKKSQWTRVDKESIS